MEQFILGIPLSLKILLRLHFWSQESCPVAGFCHHLPAETETTCLPAAHSSASLHWLVHKLYHLVPAASGVVTLLGLASLLPWVWKGTCFEKPWKARSESSRAAGSVIHCQCTNENTLKLVSPPHPPPYHSKETEERGGMWLASWWSKLVAGMEPARKSFDSPRSMLFHPPLNPPHK